MFGELADYRIDEVKQNIDRAFDKSILNLYVRKENKDEGELKNIMKNLNEMKTNLYEEFGLCN